MKAFLVFDDRFRPFMLKALGFLCDVLRSGSTSRPLSFRR